MVIELSLSFDFEETHQSVVSGSLKRAEKLLSIRGYNRNNLISLIRLRVISRYRAAAPPASLSSSPRTENYVTLCDATPAVHRRLEENFQEETRFGRFGPRRALGPLPVPGASAGSSLRFRGTLSRRVYQCTRNALGLTCTSPK